MKICKEDVIARLQQIKQMYIWNSAAMEKETDDMILVEIDLVFGQEL